MTVSHDIVAQLAARQTMFWVASVLLAMGAACLAACLMMLVRRSRIAARTPDAVKVLEKTESEFLDRPAGSPGLAPKESLLRPSGCAEEPSLPLLLRRLQAAGDRLEEIAGDLDAAASAPDEYALKERARGVEYVFKARGA